MRPPLTILPKTRSRRDSHRLELPLANSIAGDSGSVQPLTQCGVQSVQLVGNVLHVGHSSSMGSSQSTNASLGAAAGPAASEPVTQPAADRISVGGAEGCAGGAPAAAGAVSSEPVTQPAAARARARAGAGAGAGAAGGADEGDAAVGRSPVRASTEARSQRVGATCGTRARSAMRRCAVSDRITWPGSHKNGMADSGLRIRIV